MSPQPHLTAIPINLQHSTMPDPMEMVTMMHSPDGRRLMEVRDAVSSTIRSALLVHRHTSLDLAVELALFKKQV